MLLGGRDAEELGAGGAGLDISESPAVCAWPSPGVCVIASKKVIIAKRLNVMAPM